MSLFKKIKKGLRKVGKGASKVANISQAISNPAAYAMQMSYSGASARQQFAAPPQYSDYGGSQGYGGQGMSMIRTGGQPARLGQNRQLARQASRLPGPAGKVAGGLILIGGWLYDQFGNRVRRAPSRRGKGITATQLKAFTRVTHILDKYCKIKPPGGARRTTHRSTRAKACR